MNKIICKSSNYEHKFYSIFYVFKIFYTHSTLHILKRIFYWPSLLLTAFSQSFTPLQITKVLTIFHILAAKSMPKGLSRFRSKRYERVERKMPSRRGWASTPLQFLLRDALSQLLISSDLLTNPSTNYYFIYIYIIWSTKGRPFCSSLSHTFFFFFF